MEEYSYTVRFPAPPDEAFRAAANHLLQYTGTALGQLAAEQAKLQEGAKQLAREKAQLAAENAALREEVLTFRKSDAAAPKAPPAVRAMVPPGFDAGRAAAPSAERFRLKVSKQLHQAPVHSVAMDLNKHPNKRVATAAWDGTVNIYDLEKGDVVKTLGGPNSYNKMDGLYAVAYAKTEPGIIGCTSRDTNIYIWNTETGQPLNKLSGHKNEVNGVDFHTTQMVMCTASDDMSVIIWDFKEGMTLRELTGHEAEVYGCKFLGNEHEYYVASCSFDRKVRIWDMRDKNIVKTLKGVHTRDIIGIDYWSDNRMLATGSDDGRIALWDARMSWTLNRVYNAPEDSEVKRVAFSPEGLLAAACSTGDVLVYDVKHDTAGDSKPWAKLSGHTDCVFDVAWGTSPETSAPILVSASHDKTIRYWEGVKGAFK